MARHKKKLCKGWIASKRHAEKHTRKVFREMDAERAKEDQMELKL